MSSESGRGFNDIVSSEVDGVSNAKCVEKFKEPGASYKDDAKEVEEESDKAGEAQASDYPDNGLKKPTGNVEASSGGKDRDTKLDTTDKADGTFQRTSCAEKGTEEKVATPSNKELLSVITTASEANLIARKVSTNVDKKDDSETISVRSVKFEAAPNAGNGMRNDTDTQSRSPDAVTIVDKATSDVSLTALKSKFSWIGAPQLVPRTSTPTVKVVSVVSAASAIKPTLSSAPSTSGTKTRKRTERFLIKNASKVSKIYKVSNLSYKIKPVKDGMLGPNTKCPVIFVGEPAFTDVGEFTNVPGASLPTKPEEIKQEDLYDISKVLKAFSPPEKVAEKKVPFATKYPCPDIPHPSLNFRTNFPTLPRTVDRFVPSIYSTSFPHLNPGGMIRIVARTVPSATVASHIVTNTRKVMNFTNTPNIPNYNQVRPKIVPRPTPNVGPISARQHAAPPARVITTPQIRTAQNVQTTTSAQQGVMMINVTTPPSAVKPDRFKVPPQLVKTITTQPLAKMNVTSTVTIKAPAPVVLKTVHPVPVATNSGIATPTKKPVVYKSDDKTNAPKTITKIASTVAEKIVTKQVPPVLKVVPESKPKIKPVVICPGSHPVPKIPSSMVLREGVEVLFEDGVRHFMTSLKHMTYQDDETIKSWSDLKKGAKVAARWVNGQMYDATVVGCYFSVENKLQPVVEVERLKEKDLKMTYKIQKRAESDTNIGCSQCRLVFTTVQGFRKHQRVVCKSPGIIVPKSARAVTDEMIEAVKGEDPSLDTLASSAGKNTKKKLSLPSSKHGNKDVRAEENPPEKKRKLKHEDHPGSSVFQKGTKFLHRWQLDDGSSKWYRGEVLRVVSADKAFLDREFEVSYKGEDENYVLKLYEDYPSDIRIIGKT